MKTLKKIAAWFATVALAGWLGQTTALGQESSATGTGMMGHGRMGTNMPSGMMGHGRMAEHQKIMSERNKLDADLNQKVAQMNQAQGSAKLDAMAAVINDLVKERQLMREQMNLMHQRMRSHMREMMGMDQGATNSPPGGGAGTP